MDEEAVSLHAQDDGVHLETGTYLSETDVDQLTTTPSNPLLSTDAPPSTAIDNLEEGSMTSPSSTAEGRDDETADPSPVSVTDRLLGSWQRGGGEPSLPEAYGSISVPEGAGTFRKLLAYIGPGYCVAVGESASSAPSQA